MRTHESKSKQENSNIYATNPDQPFPSKLNSKGLPSCLKYLKGRGMDVFILEHELGPQVFPSRVRRKAHGLNSWL